uniref:Uncharacterized protein n=1 Tax=viral metagenome TaxID=1070528 RepID=A0A6M3L1W1_9ZZZZ
METQWQVKFTDLEAAFQALQGEFEGVMVEGMEELRATYSRYAMDGNGYHVGYEETAIQWKVYSKEELGIMGIPTCISELTPYVVCLDNYEITGRDYPLKRSLIVGFVANVSNVKGGKATSRQDDDFIHQEVQGVLSCLAIPDAVFDGEKGEWHLGDVTYRLNPLK